MNVQDCGLGYYTPKFHELSDIAGIRKTFFENGMVFLNDCEEKSLVSLSKRLGRIVRPRNEAGHGTGVSNIRCAPGLEGKGYSSEELFFHTDRSGWGLPPQILITTLKTKSESGGESLLADSCQVIAAIRSQDPHLYNLITSDKYTSFKSDDGRFEPRPIYDLESGIFRIRFDDGVQMSASLIEKFPALRTIIYQHAFAIELQPGQSYLIDNHRFMHGRTSFTGHRELLRVLAFPHSVESTKITAILFDVDGTLCRAESLSIDAYYRCLSDVVGARITHENTRINLHGQTDASLLRDILKYHGFDEHDTAVTLEKFFKLHPKYLEESLTRGFASVACTDAKEAIDWLSEQLRERGPVDNNNVILVGLLTGNSRPNALLKIHSAGIDTSIFELDISTFGDAHPTRLSLVQDAISKMQNIYGVPVDARDVTLVGDTPLDVECAHVAGCNIVAVATGHYSLQKLAELNPSLSCGTLKEAKVYLSKLII